MNTDDVVKRYDISAGWTAPVLKNKYQLSFENQNETWVELFTAGNSEPIAVTGENALITLSNKTVSGKDAPFVYQADSNRGQSVTVENGTCVISSADTGGLRVAALSEIFSNRK